FEPHRAALTAADRTSRHARDAVAHAKRRLDVARLRDRRTVRNRDLWTVTARHNDGSITVTHTGGHGTVTLPGDYVRAHVRLGYTATEHGTQSDTVTIGIHLASAVTGRRGLYVGATRGRERNTIHVITDSDDLDEARAVLEAVLAADRADTPAVAQRQFLAELVIDRSPPAQSPQQAPWPRAVIPASWADVEAWARDQLDAAREAIRTSDQRRQELDDCEAALGQATAAFEPHRAALTAADRTSRHARDAVAHAKRRLDGSRLRDRRSARKRVDHRRTRPPSRHQQPQRHPDHGWSAARRIRRRRRSTSVRQTSDGAHRDPRPVERLPRPGRAARAAPRLARHVEEMGARPRRTPRATE
ncbi:MAG: hypothetical protein M3Q82_10980, partial [Actinomycetota bacterium]|nr:hypothetical protein [Actinomycetota bacterium]